MQWGSAWHTSPLKSRDLDRRRGIRTQKYGMQTLSFIRRLFVTCDVFIRYFFVTFSWLFRGFFVALICLEKQCLGVFRGFFVVFSWLFRGPHFGQILRVLALEQSSDFMLLSLLVVSVCPPLEQKTVFLELSVMSQKAPIQTTLSAAPNPLDSMPFIAG